MSGRYATEQGSWNDRQGKNTCETHGHIFGFAQKCIFCKTEKPHGEIPPGSVENPRNLPRHIVSALVSADRCPNCLGELDTGWECNSCGYDAKHWIEVSKAHYDAAHNNREG